MARPKKVNKEIPQQNNYGLLLTPDIKLQRKYFAEMVKLQGIIVGVQTPKADKHYSEHGELKTNYNEEIKIGCIFEEYPAQKTMRKLGWFTEDGLAPIIHLPYDIKDLQIGTLISIPSAFEGSKNRLFRVTEMSTLMVYPASVTCKLCAELTNSLPLAATKDFSNSTFNVLKEVNGFDHTPREDISIRSKS